MLCGDVATDHFKKLGGKNVRIKFLGHRTVIMMLAVKHNTTIL